ncbi:unnamed protein product [Ceutorhynchus assimilis]|uniref:Very long-chain fatty acid transport protein n=1 Tax=Ceutorhynchus assimilis TaxID=467358 RepID=A0A9N9QLY8_9CUCU|nr:unnamed protein product [Ceutorhynchus assimilis]
MLFWPVLLILLVTYLLNNRRYRWIYILYKTLPRDLTAGYRFLKLNLRLSKWKRNRETIPKVFSQLAEKHPDKVAFYFEEETWTFEKLERLSNQIAHYFKSKGYKKGDSVALLLDNRPEYVALWLGLSKIGVISALINTNLVADSLFHSIIVAHCKALIYGTDFSKAVSEISDKIKDLEHFEFGSKSFDDEIKMQPSTYPEEVESVELQDKVIYIYTSGTTGLPKAAVVSHLRYMYAAGGAHILANLSSEDVFYNPLPLYHSAGGMIAVGQALLFGNTIALRKKFSATNYWSDCKKYNCTTGNYIGEICRYLLAVHKPGTKVEHNVKKLLGNGLRPQIWNNFINTFGVQVYEFYGSTEGNSNLINIDNTVGAVGFVPRYADFIYSVILIRCDENSGEPLRNKEGLCSACQPDEPGLLVGKIQKKMAHAEFSGYADEKATEKKVLRDVFEKGDAYFNSGDVLIQDELGNYFFKDRTGDTFRWKGENVATSEVEAVISNIVELKDAVVYGVQIPGTEGRAGMAAIVDSDNNLDLEKLASGLRSKLPGYAIPMFLRIMDSLPMTGTFKLKKVELQKEGFDYYAIKDHRLYFYNAKVAEYEGLTQEIYDDIVNGKMKL